MSLAVVAGLILALPGAAQTPRQADLTGPIEGGERGQPFGGFGSGAAPAGTAEEEWFVEGTASSFTKANDWGTDGRWDVAEDELAPYAVRMLVRRPVDDARFNGVVVVEWLNVSAQAEGAADYMQMEEEILREGYAWIGVGTQAVGIHAPGTGLKAWDPVRYEPLQHPGDRFSYDIFSQVARAIRSPGEGGRLLPGLTVEHVVATGRSQSAFRLVTYLNAFHLRERLFDGYFVHSRGSTAAALRAEALTGDAPIPVPQGARIREDIGVPVFDLQTEGDMVALGSLSTRQPASDTYRRWEIAGAAHAEEPRWVVETPPALSAGPGCARPVNAAPHHAFVKAGLRALIEWVTSGTTPPQSPDILIGESPPDPIRRDGHGNALGGVRIPQIEAPTATLNGLPNSIAANAPGGQNFCFLFGNTVPFDDEQLRELYPTHDVFVTRFVAAVDALEREGYLLPPEAEAHRRAARESGIGR